MSYTGTFDSVCVLLEEYADADIETVANQLLSMLGLLGDDILQDLDPPPGLQHWLTSHGLGLVTVTEARSPRVWDALNKEDRDEEEDDDPEEVVERELPLQVGDHVEYMTAPAGPNRVQQIGAGWVDEVCDDGGIFVVVNQFSPAIYIAPEEGDTIRRLAPGPVPQQSVEVPPL